VSAFEAGAYTPRNADGTLPPPVIGEDGTTIDRTKYQDALTEKQISDGLIKLNKPKDGIGLLQSISSKYNTLIEAMQDELEAGQNVSGIGYGQGLPVAAKAARAISTTVFGQPSEKVARAFDDLFNDELRKLAGTAQTSHETGRAMSGWGANVLNSEATVLEKLRVLGIAIQKDYDTLYSTTNPQVRHRFEGEQSAIAKSQGRELNNRILDSRNVNPFLVNLGAQKGGATKKRQQSLIDAALKKVNEGSP